MQPMTKPNSNHHCVGSRELVEIATTIRARMSEVRGWVKAVVSKERGNLSTGGESILVESGIEYRE